MGRGGGPPWGEPLAEYQPGRAKAKVPENLGLPSLQPSATRKRTRPYHLAHSVLTRQEDPPENSFPVGAGKRSITVSAGGAAHHGPGFLLPLYIPVMPNALSGF